MGKPDVKHGRARAHRGHRSRATRRAYDKQPGHLPGRPSTAERSTGVNPQGARADRPADAEPDAAAWKARGSRPYAPARSPRCASRSRAPSARRATRRRRRCVPRCAVETDGVGALASCSRRSSGSRRRARGYDDGDAGAARRALRRPRATGAARCGACSGRSTTLVVPPFAGATTVDVPSRARTTSRSRRRSTWTRSTTARCRSSCCSAAPSSTPARTARLQVPRGSRGSARPSYRLPVSVWREAIDAHFPDSAWLRRPREVFDRLVAYRRARALPTWEAVLEDAARGGAE